jgi:hypothetical protein
MQMSKNDLDILEAFIDKYGIVDVLSGLSYICGEKAEHIAHSWQDASLAKHWMRLAEAVDKAGVKITGPEQGL